MDRYFFIGDIHGSVIPIIDLVEKVGLDTLKKSNNYLILLGDVGANFYLNSKDDSFKKRLGEYPFTYFCIRGNHEYRPSNLLAKDEDHWDIESFFNGLVLVEESFPYIKYALDTVSTYIINGLSTLVIPGAYSVDKFIRLQNNWPWFEDEQLSESEMKYGKKLIKKNNNSFDLVLSHTCPTIYEPTDLFLSQIDQSMVDKTMERYLGSIEYTLDYKFWLWGHYHKFRAYPVTEDKRERYMLDCKNVLELKDGKLERLCLVYT